jgi:hypothetical protein
VSRARGKAKPDLAIEIRRLQKTQALLIAIQYAANHECEFDVSDALAVIVELNEESLIGLDRLEVTCGRE